MLYELIRLYFFLGFTVVYTTVVLYWKNLKTNFKNDSIGCILFCLLLSVVVWPGLIYGHVSEPEPIEW